MSVEIAQFRRRSWQSPSKTSSALQVYKRAALSDKNKIIAWKRLLVKYMIVYFSELLVYCTVIEYFVFFTVSLYSVRCCIVCNKEWWCISFWSFFNHKHIQFYSSVRAYDLTSKAFVKLIKNMIVSSICFVTSLFPYDWCYGVKV